MSAAAPGRVQPETVAMVLAVLVAITSVAAILNPDTYSRETLAWRVQVEIQDWFDLLVLTPFLIGSALLAKRGSRTGTFVLGGSLMYAAYNMAIYAFAVHFNRFFIAYCVSLGLSVLALVLLFARWKPDQARDWFRPEGGRKFPAVVLVVLGLAFLGLWLSELVPASIRNAPSQTLVDVGLPTNPVHALDLSVTLPLLIFAGVALWQGRPSGYLLAPMVLVFAVMTDASIIAIILYSNANGVPAELAVAVGIGVSAVVTLAALALLLRQLSPLDEDGPLASGA